MEPDKDSDATRIDQPKGERRIVVEGYQVLEKLGEGGFGAVYRARQFSPVRRDVALKVLHPGFDSGDIEARFKRERQALAVMDHPGIAKIFDAGRTEDGRSFFAMEYVDGVPVDAFCVGARLSVRERLGLFVDICRALQHAHAKGIIHRDIKPTNILVGLRDGAPAPVVIDFGVAKVARDAEWSRSFVTMDAPLVGTPAFMSPEHVSNRIDVDVRADIYSLGAVLYELLTETRPTDKPVEAKPPVEEVLRRVVDFEPPRPSVRLAALLAAQAARDADRARVDASIVRGDLDWMVMKAIAKNRDERYQTAAAFAEDIERWLEGRPVAARPPSAGYLAVRFARRHRAGIGAALAALLLLLSGTIGTTIGFLRARDARSAAEAAEGRAIKQRDEALKNADLARSINTFLNDDLLGALAPEALGTDVSMRDALEVAAKRLEDRPEARPEVDIALRITIGRTFARIGRIDRGAPFVEDAAERARKLLPEADPLAASAVHELAEIRQFQARYDVAYAGFEAAKALRVRASGPNDADTLRSEYGAIACLSEMRKNDEAALRIDRLLAVCRERLGPNDRLTIKAMRGRALILTDLQKLAEAADGLKEALDAAVRAFGEGDLLAFQLMADLSVCLADLGRFDESEALFRRSEAAGRKGFGDEHPTVLVHLARRAHFLLKRGDAAAAEPLMRRAADGLARNLGGAHPLTVTVASGLCRILGALKRWNDAIDRARLLVGAIDAAASPPRLRADVRIMLADVCEAAGRAEEAAAARREAAEFAATAPDPVEKAGEKH